MGLSNLFNWRQDNRNVWLRVALREHDVSEVERLLRKGANPNDYADSADHHLPLANAIRYNAPLEIFNVLLKHGADPQEPFCFMGREFKLSEAAELSKRSHEIVRRLKEAELEAEAKNGPRELFRGYVRTSCRPLKFGT